jgi:hypothetical protein
MLILTLVCEKNANFFAENCQKSQKIVIITSTPDWPKVRPWGKNPPYQKCRLGCILKGLRMANVGIFYDHLEYFTAIWYNLWPFGICSLWSFGIFFQFLNAWTKKKLVTLPGLPDDIFTYQKYRIGCILKDLRIENAGLFYGYVKYFTANWYILRPFWYI